MTGGEQSGAPGDRERGYSADSASSMSNGFPGDQHPAQGNDQTGAEFAVPPGPRAAAPDVATRKPRKSRARAAVISALFGVVLVSIGIYLIGGFGARLYDTTTGSWMASTSDIVLAGTGALCLFVAVLLNGWSPWATAVPGAILTAIGVWSAVSVDGAGRVATFVDAAVGRGDLILPGVHILVLVIGLLLLGASGAVTIARSAGRTRGRA